MSAQPPASNAPAGDDRPLHTAFPTLAATLPHLALAKLPTPIIRRDGPAGPLLIKCDGRSHPAYGGNKVRKLEYLFGQALSHGCKQVATFGAAGSNHATATAVHAQSLGLGCINFLSRQRQTPWVADNLRIQLAAGARLVFVDGDRASREHQARQVLERTTGRTWLIPMGGSSIAGTIGYVNAGFELADQINRGVAAKPDRVYLPLGTMGTAVGLIIGLMAAGMSIPVSAVRVVHLTFGSEALAQRLFERTVRALHKLDGNFPALRFSAAPLTIHHEQFGDGYAAPTDAAKAASQYAERQWGLVLETTYSAKTVAALLADQQAGLALYWATYSEAHPRLPDSTNDSALPEPLRPYLEH